MLDKLAKRVKQDWKTYAQVFSVAAYLVGLLFYFFPKSVIALLLGICFWFAPTLLVRFFGWLRLRYLNDLAMQLGSRNSESRNGAFNRLLRLGEKAVPIFVSILSTPPSQFDALDWDGVKARRLAAKGLGILKAKEGLEELVRALNDSNEILKETAIWALGQIGDQRAITVLLPLLGEPLPRCEVVRSALRDLGAGEIIDAWHQALKQSNRDALEKLRAYRNEIVEALFRGLEQRVFRETVALNAVWALGELGTADITPRLFLLALDHPSEKVGKLCMQTVVKLDLISRLPRPSTSPSFDPSTLPRPAIAHEFDTRNLPAIPLPDEKGSNE